MFVQKSYKLVFKTIQIRLSGPEPETNSGKITKYYVDKLLVAP